MKKTLSDIPFSIIEKAINEDIEAIDYILAHYRNFDYLYELSCINDDYNYEIEAIKPMQEELALTNEKILSLSRIKEGKISDK